jgi:hypothetical protein
MVRILYAQCDADGDIEVHVTRYDEPKPDQYTVTVRADGDEALTIADLSDRDEALATLNEFIELLTDARDELATEPAPGFWSATATEQTTHVGTSAEAHSTADAREAPHPEK